MEDPPITKNCKNLLSNIPDIKSKAEKKLSSNKTELYVITNNDNGRIIEILTKNLTILILMYLYNKFCN